jgi:hypothetical protein
MAQIYIDEVTKGVIACGFCSTNVHDTCRGGYRNGNGSVLICGCECADTKPQFCHHCQTREADNLGRPWLCDDRVACEGRVQARLAKLPEYTWLRRSQEVSATSPSRPGRRAAQCHCCGEPTKGGNFLPGHDSKFLNQWVAKLDKEGLPWMDGFKAIEQVSPGLALKFKKRVYGS